MPDMQQRLLTKPSADARQGSGQQQLVAPSQVFLSYVSNNSMGTGTECMPER